MACEAPSRRRGYQLPRRPSREHSGSFRGATLNNAPESSNLEPEFILFVLFPFVFLLATDIVSYIPESPYYPPPLAQSLLTVLTVHVRFVDRVDQVSRGDRFVLLFVLWHIFPFQICPL